MRPTPRPLLLILPLALLALAVVAGAQPATDGGPAPYARTLLPPVPVEAAQTLFADRPHDRRSTADKAPASLRVVVLMCDFSDSLMYGRWGQVPGDFPPPMQGEIHYAAHDSVFFDHLMRDVREYYDTVSGGAFSFEFAVHPRTVNLPRPMAWYGDHPELGEQPIQLAADVVDSLDAEVDFSLFDTVLLVHAGAGEETDVLRNSPEQVYSTYVDPRDFEEAFEDGDLDQPYLPSADFPAGSGIDQVLILPECEYQDPVPPQGNGMYGSIGVYCYEVGLRLGMPSLVDFTPAGRPDSQGIGSLGLMGYGLFVAAGWNPPHPCAFNKMLMGWQQPVAVGVGESFGLTPAERTGEPGALARVDISGQEYWLLEYRLQNPNGYRVWSFDDDRNGNGRRDFWDADAADGIPDPGEKFDPATDSREWLVGAEWDHFMTENGANIPGLGGGGSGVYVWHVDDGVVAETYGLRANLLNSNPARFAVDLEEADGIQDLESPTPTPWYLGGDNDVFRGEQTAAFGPNTLPATVTAGGAPTGLHIRDFGKVVVDSTLWTVFEGDSLWVYEQADTVRFSVTREGVGAAELHALRTLPAGVDLGGSHALTVDLDTASDLFRRDEIVLGDRAGGVWVLDGDLNEYRDHDGDPATLEPLVVGRRGGNPVTWNLPPAVGDIDNDRVPEILLTGPNGLHAFERDGTPVRDPEPGAVGLYAALGDCAQPVVLMPVARGADWDRREPVEAVVVVRDGGTSRLQVYAGPGATLVQDHDLGDVVVRMPPVAAFGYFWLAVSDTLRNEHSLLACLDAEVSIPETTRLFSYRLAVEPGPFPVAWGVESAGEGLNWIAVAGPAGGETVFVDEEMRAAVPSVVWNAGREPRSPLAPGGALVLAGAYGRVGQTGDWLQGWPQRPGDPVAALDEPWAPAPLVADLTGSGGSFDQYLYTAADGRIFAYGTAGEAGIGWPLAGPGQAAGTPAFGVIGGAAAEDLVAVGAFPRTVGLDAAGDELVTEAVSTVALWLDVAGSGPTWPMWGGSSWRNGDWNAAGWTSPPGAAAGTGIVSGSHFCYPSPLLSGPLQVRASSRSEGRAMALIYNLEGEQVTASAWRRIPAREPFDVTVDLGGAASGMYLCRLVVESDGGGRDESVVAFAVAR